MAAEMVICENLRRIFTEEMEYNRLHRAMTFPIDWGETLKKAEFAMAELEEWLTENNTTELAKNGNRIRNLGALLYQADDLFDKILRIVNRRSPNTIAANVEAADGEETPQNAKDGEHTPQNETDGEHTPQSATDGEDTPQNATDGEDTPQNATGSVDTWQNAVDSGEIWQNEADGEETSQNGVDGEETSQSAADSEEIWQSADSEETWQNAADREETWQNRADREETWQNERDREETWQSGEDRKETSQSTADHEETGTNAQQTNVIAGVAKKVRLLFSYRDRLVLPIKMVGQVSRTSERIKNLSDQLQNMVGSTGDMDRKFESFPNVELAENPVIGRGFDKEKIIEMLVNPKTETQASVSVIRIVGLAGVGKSTLARCVYDDEEVDKHFDLKIWIPVSESQRTTEEKIIHEIVEACTNRRFGAERNSRAGKSAFSDIFRCRNLGRSAVSPSDITRKKGKNNSAIFEQRLRKGIKGKLFLLILDCGPVTIPLRHLTGLLGGAAKGSHIMLIKRSPLDHPTTNSDEIYELEGLKQNDSMNLFNKLAFGQEGTASPEKQNLAKEIVENCNGVPLVIKVAASFLHGKGVKAWLSFNDHMLRGENSAMDKVLQLSYNDLPPRLKACFGYCSLYPEDFHFHKHDLISLWIAQGYVHKEAKKTLEEVAETYFLELFRRCFFEYVRTNELRNIVTCKIHHIMRRLASQHAVGVVNMYLDDKLRALDSACKHVSFTTSTQITPSLHHATTLRTLFSVKEPDSDTKMDKLVDDKLISSFKCLRVLDLHDLAIKELPVSIGKLIHLRYLDLSKNGLVTLPNSVVELYNLQTLKLNSCTKLKRLLGNFGELVNLTRFEIDECYSLTCMPLGLERLDQLQRLSRFVVSKDCCSDLKALKKLKRLKGQLTIELSGNWANNIPKAPLRVLQEKKHLQELKITWTKTVSEQSSYVQLLEKLQPHDNLKILCIEGYKGKNLPNWAGVNMLATLEKLVVINIEGCEQCEKLPPFGKFPFLKQLTLRHMANVEYVHKESSSSLADGNLELFPVYFKSLQQLTLHNFHKLKGIVFVSSENVIPSFPCLSTLQLWNCPKLKYMPLIPKVTHLDLRNVNRDLLKVFAPNSKSIASCITCLKIKGCSNLESFEEVRRGLGDRPKLQQLTIEKCHTLSSLAKEFSGLISLVKLEIASCKKLDLSEDESNNIQEEDKNPALIPWTFLKNLSYLTLRELPKMKYLPKGLKHVQSLRSLGIQACPALTGLPEWIDSLTALQVLRIESCERVTRLPNELKKVKSLMKVDITECPELMERCKENTGEDWDKIKHAQVLLHKSWRYGLMSEAVPSQSRSNVHVLSDIKYIVIPI